MKKIFKMKRTISMKQFIAEFGGEFTKLMKQRLLELGARCVLTRNDESFVVDIRHVEHTKYKCALPEGASACMKEYAFGQFIAHEGLLYFSKDCLENEDIIQAPEVSSIFAALEGEEEVIAGDNKVIKGKRLSDSNIDHLIDEILAVCPEVSAEHLAIVSRY